MCIRDRLDEISLEFQLKPGETFQVVGLNDEYWDYFMGDQLPEEQLGQLKSGNACIVRNPIPMNYGEDVLAVSYTHLDVYKRQGMDFLDEVRAADKKLPFILASCHDKEDYEQEAKRRGATLCMDKMKGLLLQDKLVEYAYRQLSGEKAPTFHKLLFVLSLIHIYLMSQREIPILFCRESIWRLIKGSLSLLWGHQAAERQLCLTLYLVFFLLIVVRL